MDLWLDAIAVPETIACHELRALGPEHGMTPSALRMLERYFGLSSVALHPGSHAAMLGEALRRLSADGPALGERDGLLLYAKTQTHNTPPDGDWLNRLADAAGLGRWEAATVSMNHCASGLGVLDLLRRMACGRPAIALAGEKCFHRSTCRQSGAALGEMPAALLVNAGGRGWRVRHTRLTHIPRYYANPDAMDPDDRRSFERHFGDHLDAFVSETLAAFGIGADAVDLVVPYNLNLPLLARIAAARGWEERMFTATAARVGHLFCADVFYNLSLVLPRTGADRILTFAAGMGATFAAALVERGTGSRSAPS